MTRWRAPLAAAFALAATYGLHDTVQAQIFRCEADNGVPLFQNTPTGRNCKALDLSPLTSIPAPKLPAQATQRQGGQAGQGGANAPSGGQSGAQSGAGGGSVSASAAATGQGGGATAGVPRIEPAAQRARDSDRRRIIEDELKREESKLGELKRDFNGGEPERRGDERNYQKYLDRVEQMKADIARSEGNVASLRRELGALRD